MVSPAHRSLSIQHEVNHSIADSIRPSPPEDQHVSFYKSEIRRKTIHVVVVDSVKSLLIERLKLHVRYRRREVRIRGRVRIASRHGIILVRLYTTPIIRSHNASDQGIPVASPDMLDRERVRNRDWHREGDTAQLPVTRLIIR